MKNLLRNPRWASAILPVLLSIQIVCAASGPKRDPSAWSPQEINHILSDSPWAKASVAAFPPAASEDRTNVVPTGSAPGTIGYDGKWDGTPSRHLGDLPTFHVLVRWESAAPIQDARKRSAQPLHPNVAGDHYVIGILGLWSPEEAELKADETQPVLGSLRPPTIASSGGRPDHRSKQDLGHMRDELRTVSKIMRAGHSPIIADDVQLDPVTGEIQIIFPKTEAIDVNNKEVTFATRFGSMVIEKKFRLKDMLYHGKLEL